MPDKILLLMIVDVVVSLATYFITKYVDPARAQDVLYVIAALQPIVIYVIKSWKDERVAYISKGFDPRSHRPL